MIKYALLFIPFILFAQEKTLTTVEEVKAEVAKNKAVWVTKVGFEGGAPFMDTYVKKWGMTPGEFWQKAVDNGS